METTFKIKKVCCTPEERAQGLQFERLLPDECCVFVYETPHILRFWGKNTPQDLCLAFVLRGRVVDSLRIRAYDETPVVSMERASVAIESLAPIDAGASVRFEGGSVRVTSCSA